MFLVLETNGVRRWVDTDTVRQLQRNGTIVCVFETRIRNRGDNLSCDYTMDLNRPHRIGRLEGRSL